MAKRFVYTKQHLEFLRAGYKKMSYSELTIAFNEKFNLDKSADTIKSTMTNHGIKSGRSTGAYKKGVPQVFTMEQKQWFIDNYPSFTRKALTVEFNRVFNESRKESQIIAFLKNNGIKSGRTGHYKKGSVSWNKGSKGTGLCKANSGSFKKGQKAHNWVPVGTERVVEGGYIEVKTAEPHEWTQKHRIVYESVHGPIPPNHKVRFKNGDPSDIDPDNLFLVNHAEHQHLNNLGFKDHPEENKDTLILIAKVRDKTNRVIEQSN